MKRRGCFFRGCFFKGALPPFFSGGNDSPRTPSVDSIRRSRRYKNAASQCLRIKPCAPAGAVCVIAGPFPCPVNSQTYLISQQKAAFGGPLPMRGATYPEWRQTCATSKNRRLSATPDPIAGYRPKIARADSWLGKTTTARSGYFFCFGHWCGLVSLALINSSW